MASAALPERQIGERIDTVEIDADAFAGRTSFSAEEEQQLRALLQPAVALLQADQAVGMPTETVYGLAANALSDAAVGRIFAAKGRPSDNPLIVHVSSRAMMLDRLVDRRALAEPALQRQWAHVDQLIERFWPGPLTLLVPKSDAVSPLCTAGVATVAVRMPSHPIALRLIEWSALPLAAPSANISGRPSPTCAEHVRADLAGAIACIVSAGRCSHGLESTVVDVWRDPPVVLRPGAVTVEQLRQLLPDIDLFKPAATDLDKPATPGLKYRHYSPDTPVVLLELPASPAATDLGRAVAAVVGAQLAKLPPGRRLALVHTQPHVVYPDHLLAHPQLLFRSLLTTDDAHTDDPLHPVAAGMFAALRDLERQHDIHAIYFLAVPEQGAGTAIMNRIRKAASVTLPL